MKPMVDVIVTQPPPVDPTAIDWTNPLAQCSKYFTVREAIWLPTWTRLANETELTDEVKLNLTSKLLPAMDNVRDRYGLPIHVHVTLRPPAYNTLIGGAKASYHLVGLAMDFDFMGASCAGMQDRINGDGMLDSFQMRMEDNGPEAGWIHLDLGTVGASGLRFFKP